jgi:hypothetical protein
LERDREKGGFGPLTLKTDCKPEPFGKEKMTQRQK